MVGNILALGNEGEPLLLELPLAVGKPVAARARGFIVALYFLLCEKFCFLFHEAKAPKKCRSRRREGPLHQVVHIPAAVMARLLEMVCKGDSSKVEEYIEELKKTGELQEQLSWPDDDKGWNPLFYAVDREDDLMVAVICRACDVGTINEYDEEGLLPFFGLQPVLILCLLFRLYSFTLRSQEGCANHCKHVT